MNLKHEISLLNFSPSLSPAIILRAISGFPRGVTFSLFCGVTQLRFVVSHRRFGKPSSLIFKSQTVLPLKIGRISCPETSVTTNVRCVISQKSEDVTLFLMFDAVVDTVDT